jgi:hypothetical protein
MQETASTKATSTPERIPSLSSRAGTIRPQAPAAQRPDKAWTAQHPDIRALCALLFREKCAWPGVGGRLRSVESVPDLTPSKSKGPRSGTTTALRRPPKVVRIAGELGTPARPVPGSPCTPSCLPMKIPARDHHAVMITRMSGAHRYATRWFHLMHDSLRCTSPRSVTRRLSFAPCRRSATRSQSRLPAALRAASRPAGRASVPRAVAVDVAPMAAVVSHQHASHLWERWAQCLVTKLQAISVQRYPQVPLSWS